MTPRDDFAEDFGLSGLTKYVNSPFVPGTEAGCLGLADRLLDREGRVYAQEVLEDIQRLLGSPLPDEVLTTLWLAATRVHFDPAAAGLGIRTWLGRISEVCVTHVRAEDPSFDVTVLDPVPRPDLRDAVLAELRPVAASLAEAAVTNRYAAPLPNVVPALEAAIEWDCDLGFRLFLRAMKEYFVPVSEARMERFAELGRRFGYHDLVVDDPNLNVWPDLED